MIKLAQAVIVEGKYDKAKLSSLIDAVIVTTDGFDVLRNRDKLAFIRSLAEKNGIIILTDSDAAGFRIRSFLSGAIPPDRITHVYIPDVEGKERRKPAPSAEGKLGVEGISPRLLLEAFARAGITPNDTDADGVYRADEAQITAPQAQCGGLGPCAAPNASATSAETDISGSTTASDPPAANDPPVTMGSPDASGAEGAVDHPRVSATEVSAQIDKCDLLTWGISGGQDSAEKRRRLLRSLGMPARMNSNALMRVLNSLYTRDEIMRRIEKL